MLTFWNLKPVRSPLIEKPKLEPERTLHYYIGRYKNEKHLCDYINIIIDVLIPFDFQ